MSAEQFTTALFWLKRCPSVYRLGNSRYLIVTPLDALTYLRLVNGPNCQLAIAAISAAVESCGNGIAYRPISRFSSLALNSVKG